MIDNMLSTQRKKIQQNNITTQPNTIILNGRYDQKRKFAFFVDDEKCL